MFMSALEWSNVVLLLGINVTKAFFRYNWMMSASHMWTARPEECLKLLFDPLILKRGILCHPTMETKRMKVGTAKIVFQIYVNSAFISDFRPVFFSWGSIIYKYIKSESQLWLRILLLLKFQFCLYYSFLPRPLELNGSNTDLFSLSESRMQIQTLFSMSV